MKRRTLFGRGAGLLAAAAALIVGTGIGVANAATLTTWVDTVRLPQVKAYQAANPDVTLNIVTVNPGELVAKLQVLLKARGDVPDLIWMSDPNQSSLLATRNTNYLMDLTDAIDKAIPARAYKNAELPCIINGKLVCLRDNISQNVMWYNAPLLKSLGKTVPTTWEEFEKLGADLAALNKGYFLGTGGAPLMIIGLLEAGGCQLALPVEGKPDTLKIDLTTDTCIKPAKMIDDMLANGTLTKEDQFSPTFTAAAVDGKLVMALGPTWFGEFVIKPVYKWAPKTLGIALPPKWSYQDQPLTWSWGGGSWGVYKDTKSPKEALALLTWLAASADNQQNGVTLPADQPASLVWGKKLMASGYYANDDAFDVLVKAADYASPGYIALRFGYGTAVSKAASPVINSGGKLVDALPALQTELINEAKVAGYTIE